LLPIERYTNALKTFLDQLLIMQKGESE
jgi:hypothetical protein